MFDENCNTQQPANSMAMLNHLMNVKDSRWLQLEVCREFQRGQCSRTEFDCKFAHPPPHVEVQNGKVMSCYDSIKVSYPFLLFYSILIYITGTMYARQSKVQISSPATTPQGSIVNKWTKQFSAKEYARTTDYKSCCCNGDTKSGGTTGRHKPTCRTTSCCYGGECQREHIILLINIFTF
jgi:hypothetical protein